MGAMVVDRAYTPPSRRLTDSSRVGWASTRAIPVAILAITAVAFVTPLGYVLRTAVQDDAGGIRRMFDDDRLWETVRTTIVLTVGSVVFSVVVGTALAWFAHRLPAGRRWMGVIPLVPLVLPQLALVVGFAFLFSSRAGFMNRWLRALPGIGGRDGPFDVYTVPWMILIAGLSLSAFVFLFLRSALGQIQSDLIDAALVAGRSPTSTFMHVVLPLLRPAMVYAVATVTLLGMGQFTVPLLLGRQEGTTVLTTEMYLSMQQYPIDYGRGAAYAMPIVVAGLLFLVGQRIMLRDQSRFVSMTGRGAQPLSRCGWRGQLALVLYGVVTAVLPLGALLIVSFQQFWTPDIAWSDLSLENYRTVLFDRDDLVEAITNSLRFAVLTTLVVLPLGYLCARLIYRRRQMRMLAGAQDLVVSLPLGIPSVIFGAGFLFFFIDSPITLYGTTRGVVLVYVTILIPFVTRFQLSAMINLGDSFGAAAAVHGAGPLRRMFTVDLPLLRPALGAAAALVVILTTHEFSASVLVRANETQVIGTVMYDLWEYGSYPQTAVLALVMCAVTGGGVLLALAIGGRGAARSLGRR